MTNLKAVAHFGTTPERLKQVFTAEPIGTTDDRVNMPKEEIERREADVVARERIEKFIRERLNEGVLLNLENYRIYAARDLAMDCPPVNKFTLPLMLYAQGKIKVANVATELSRLPSGDKYVKKGANGQLELNLPKFLDVNVNLCRSIITRRLSAQANKYNNLWPFYKYEPRGTSQVAKLRADALSQAVDIMADGYGYRHHDVQVIRDMMVHAHCVDFQRASWEQSKSYRMNGDEPESYVCKEGITFTNPHPSRVFWDNAEPLAGINDDIGPAWIGYWDIVRYHTVNGNTKLWNRDKLKWNADFWTQVAAYNAYWDQYYTDRLTPPVSGAQQDPAGQNDRINKIGYYSGLKEDASVLLANLYWKVRPVEWGLGNYPEPVWLRLMVSGDGGTVCYAEVMPSTPAAYAGLNENDNRLINVSFLDELMPFQDQMTNLTTVMLELVNASMLKIIAINSDVLTAEQIAAIRERLKAQYRSTAEPLVIEWSLTKLIDELKLPSVDKLLTIAETSGVGNALTECLRAMALLAEQAEKLANISPNEQGQPAPREISATEVNEISATTSSVYSFISDAIDEFRAAKKRMIYESMCNFKDTLRVPVISRYTAKTIKAAGFEVDENDTETVTIPGGGQVVRATLLGTMKNLEHDYIFTSRDGSERAVNTQAANTLTQLMQYLTQLPQIANTFTTEQLYEMLNEIFRMSGSGYDLKLEMMDGQENGLGTDQIAAFGQAIEQLIAHTQNLAGAVKQNSADIAQQAGVNAQQEKMLEGMQTIADALKQNVMETKQAQMDTKRLELEIRKKAIIDYKNAPADVQRQMELDAGYVPSRLPAEPHGEPRNTPKTQK